MSAEGAKPPKPVAVSLTPRETRERALLAMCISKPEEGRRFIDRLTEEHLSPSGRPALAWLREHLEDPMAGLPRDDPALTSLITELVMRAESEPASEGAMQLNFDLLEQQRLEDGIAAAQKAGDYEARPACRASEPSSPSASRTRASWASQAELSHTRHIRAWVPSQMCHDLQAFADRSVRLAAENACE